MNDFHNKMMEKIRTYSNDKYLDGYIHDEFLTDDQDADIFMKLDSKNQLFDSRTVQKQCNLRSEVFEFLEDKTSMLDNDMKIHFHIMGLDLSTHEKEEVHHIFKEHYAIELYKVQKKYIACRNKIVFLILFGLLSFACYTVFYFFYNLDFFLTVFIFLFTFSLWEAFACLIYTFSDIRNEREAITQNLLMTVTFDDEERKE